MIGVAVDDTIHFLARFNAEARARGSERAAVGHALGSILRPVTLTTAALCLSFAAFLLSPLASHAEFGALAALALLLAWLTDILVTPALGSMVRIVTLWDLLRADLGSSPQLTIPLLSDFNKEVSAAYGAQFEDLMGLKGIAKRSAFVVDGAGTIRYASVSDDPKILPDFAAIKACLQSLN